VHASSANARPSVRPPPFWRGVDQLLGLDAEAARDAVDRAGLDQLDEMTENVERAQVDELDVLWYGRLNNDRRR